MIIKPKDITDYIINDEDSKIVNPYLEEVFDIINFIKEDSSKDGSCKLSDYRSELIGRYAFSIPTVDILKIIVSYSPILEIGAGSGYWAMCLSQLGARVQAFDNRPPEEHSPWDWQMQNPWFDEKWYYVMPGDENNAGDHPEMSLLLAWPPYHNTMAYESLCNYQKSGGKYLLYIGDEASSGDKLFHNELKKYRLVECHNIPGWPGIEETLQIYSLI